MNREAIGPVVLAAVCVLAVVFAAATLSSPQQAGTGELGTGDDEDDGGFGDDPGGSGVDVGGDEAEDDGFLEAPQGERLNLPQPCVPFLKQTEVVLGIVLAFLAFAYVVKRRYDIVAAVGLTFSFSLPVVLLYLLLTLCSSTSGPSGLPDAIVGGGSGGDGSVGLGESGLPVEPTAVPVWVYAILGVVLLGVLAFAFSDRGGFGAALGPIWSGPDEEEGDGGAPAGAATRLGRLAGEAADRIEADDEGTSVENEVYRAWREMTDPLDVDRPESSTPAEFATAAVEAGVDRSDVDELTELFEEVRYGGYDPDERRERRAVDALRRIERQYADDGGGEP